MSKPKKATVKKEASKPAAPKPAPAAVEEAPKPKRTGPVPQLLRGMRDILPAEQKYWAAVRGKAEALAAAFGFDRIDTPIMEETALFVRAVGKQTDIVEKEMFSFEDQGGDHITLRPEATAAIARAYVGHGMWNQPQPVKLFYEGPMFRRERPQAGRHRQFHQAGCEVLGDKHPVIDAELVFIAYTLYKELGLDVIVRINSIGDSASRENYKAQLVQYYRTKRSALCENCKKRLVRNPMRLLDCKEEGCVGVRAEAPQIVDYLGEESKNRFVRVLEYLDELDVPYQLDPHLVRGLDYYSDTVFEIAPADDGEGSQSALAGGGRYDGLVELLGGQPTPACGFAWGIERTILRLKEKAIAVPDLVEPEVFVAQLGEPARRKTLALFNALRLEGVRTAESFSRDALKQQLEIANRLGVRYTLIVGQKEVLDGTVLIRDMDSGIQEIVDFKKAVAEIKRKLAQPAVPKAPPPPPPPEDPLLAEGPLHGDEAGEASEEEKKGKGKGRKEKDG